MRHTFLVKLGTTAIIGAVSIDALDWITGPYFGPVLSFLVGVAIGAAFTINWIRRMGR